MKDDANLESDVFKDDEGGFNPLKKPVKPGHKAFIYLILFFSIIMVGFSIYSGLKGHNVSSTEKKPEMFANTLPKYEFGKDDDLNHPLPKTRELPPLLPSNPELDNDKVPFGEFDDENEKHKKTPEELANERRLSSGLNDGNSSSNDKTAQNASGQDDVKENGDSQALAQLLNVKGLKPAMAGVMKHQNFIVATGTIIPCGTQEEIDTTLPGGITCRVSQDVWSVNGKVRLIDKGALIDGEIASGAKFGQNRIFVNWVRLRNPDGIVINLDSEGVNDLGSAGYEASLNDHFWARFGDAILISVFTDLGQTMVQSVTNLTAKSKTASIQTNQSSETGQQMAEEALKVTLNIPPSLYLQQGEAVNIYVARDLDFSNVYKLSDR